MRLFFGLLLLALQPLPKWIPQDAGTTASFRGVSAVNDRTVWASGTGGTFLLTTDAGATWKSGKVPGAEKLDFRGLHAVDDHTAYLLSIGSGESSRVYKTADAGAHWDLLFTNPDAKGFFDAIAFWDPAHGIVLGDAVDGHAIIFTTEDAGRHWMKQQTPNALPNEGAFAASNSCLVTVGKNDAWFITGGASVARIFHSTDRGKSWTVVEAPLRHDAASAGGFSLTFSDAQHGIAVGGDYAKDKESAGNIAITADGGKSWHAPAASPAGFRSAVVYVPGGKFWITTGTSGSDISRDGGESWQTFDTGSYNAISFAAGSGWAVGARGRIANFSDR